MQAIPAGVYSDFQGLAALKHEARTDQAGSLNKVSRQFESLFVQMMLKQMRQASFGGGLFDSDKTRFYQDMYDKQLALNLAERGGIGIGEMLREQLTTDRQWAQTDGLQAVALGNDLAGYRDHPTGSAIRHLKFEQGSAVDEPAVSDMTPEAPVASFDSPETFVQSLWPAARQAAAEIGIAPEALLAQAALETGWGRHVMSDADGGSSHNLFGIKADGRWGGTQVRRETLEYADGVALRKREAFRAYGSFDESFRDYVNFLQSSPRYAEALSQGHDSRAYFSALQQAGYATDPDYAQKILRVMHGPEMRTALQGFKGDETRPI